jgi:hypothetical protein
MRNAEELRGAINAGRTGDKVRWSDPAASPLGTDEEAAGEKVPAHAVKHAGRIETARPQHKPEPLIGGAAWAVIISTLVMGAIFIAAGYMLR